MRGITPVPCVRPGIEAVRADTRFAFGRHTHAQFGIGLIARGAQRSASGRGMVEAGPGDIITVNPGEVHDGAAIGDAGRAWRMLYIQPAALAEAGHALALHDPEFAWPVRRLPGLAARFHVLFAALTEGDELAGDESLLILLAALMQARPSAMRATPAGIARARAAIDDDPVAAPTIAGLARAAGLGPFQLLRGFARATGLTPHAYLMQRRIHRARDLIARGLPLARAAAEAGFADQSHMTRLFVRSFGATPGAYARAAAIPFKTRP